MEALGLSEAKEATQIVFGVPDEVSALALRTQVGFHTLVQGGERLVTLVERAMLWVRIL